ncbi:aspartate aminotransferase family protein [Actinophytocola oryzae]|uniref:Glutamate-1-semialdehyde 2,1-aminomutase n=1 Tax=Actinophytocola oryzae TaxID=502181 RepID=A0A4R7W5C3_9PSEU|nr:aspartate aminotransferase family protein [Actinophytocola oryzae]TDV57772.1 glutamate-1-semialdehyde 2,1-aminomutase [Actinophytocola oryzae]
MPSSAHPRGQAIADAAARVIPGGVNSSTRYIGAPYSFASAEGAYVVDADGNRYLDYHAAFGAILLGHNAAVVNDAVRATIGGIDLVGLGVTEGEVALAERVVEIIPSAESMIATMSGSEAVAQAIRLARGVTGRDLVVKFQGGFHGWSDAVARNVISAPDKAYGSDPLSSGILPQALDSTLIAEFNDLDSVTALFDQYPDRVAAVIMEPIPHNVGALLPTTEFVSGLRKLTEVNDALLIFDEVITGLRHSLGGYQEVIGITPDLTTFGKGLANGYASGGVAGRRDLMEHFNGRTGDVLLAGTFNGNPIGCAAALATIGYLQEHPDFYERTFALGDRMRTGLTEIVTELDIEATALGFGGVFVLYFTKPPILGYRDLMRNNDEAYVAFHRGMTERGFLMLPMALKRNHISGAHTAEDVDRTLDAARDVLVELRATGTV